MRMSVIFRRGIGIARTRLTNLEEGFPILTDQASKVIHGTISDILDIYHFYTAAHFIVDLPEFKNLHRQLAKDHCQQVQEWVRFLHLNRLEIQMEDIFISNKSVHYHTEMALEKTDRTMADFLLKLTKDALVKEEALQQYVNDKENIFVHLENRENAEYRCDILDVCKQHLVQMRNDDLKFGKLDHTIIEELADWSRAGYRPLSSLPAEVTYQQLAAALHHGTATLIDVRGREEVAKHGSIPGALNIPLPELASVLVLPPQQFEAVTGVALELDSPLVFTCRMFWRGWQATGIARTVGFSNCSHYRGGWLEWNRNQSSASRGAPA